MMRSMHLVIVSLIATSILASAKDARRPIGVCELLTELQRYRDKIVTIRGELVTTDEGVYLDEKCPKPLVTSGFVWTNPIGVWLTQPGSNDVENRTSPAPETDVRPTADDLLKKYVTDSSVRIWVTVTGRLETREKFLMVLRGDGKTVPFGYGHMNACPAQLVCYQMKDVFVERRSPPGRKTR
jgi:hypothetical protein